MKIKHISYWIAIVAAFLLLAYSELAAEEQNKSVIGPRNTLLADGVDALLAGEAVAGVRLTLRGLEVAHGQHEVKVGRSNLCAGYVMLKKPLTALPHCNWILERYPNHWRTYNNRALAYLQLERFEESAADIARGQALRPGSNKLKISRGLLLDETHPVAPSVEIDERRSAMEDSGNDDSQD